MSIDLSFDAFQNYEKIKSHSVEGRYQMVFRVIEGGNTGAPAVSKANLSVVGEVTEYTRFYEDIYPFYIDIMTHVYGCVYDVTPSDDEDFLASVTCRAIFEDEDEGGEEGEEIGWEISVPACNFTAAEAEAILNGFAARLDGFLAHYARRYDQTSSM